MNHPMLLGIQRGANRASMKTNKSISDYMASIGAKGGKASKRKITPEQQAKMQAARKKASRRNKK